MIVNYLVVAALVSGQPTSGTNAGQTAIVSQPTDYQVLPALGISGSRSSGSKTPDAIAAKYSSGGAASWKSTTRQVSALQPAPAEPEPAAPAAPEPPAPTEPPPLVEEPPVLAPPPAAPAAPEPPAAEAPEAP